MDVEIREALREIHDDIKKLLPMEQMVARHETLLYGNGHDGILTSVEKFKARHKVYDKVFGVIGALVTAVFGDAFWRHIR